MRGLLWLCQGPVMTFFLVKEWTNCELHRKYVAEAGTRLHIALAIIV